MKTPVAALGLLLLPVIALANPVTGWVRLAGNTGFAAGTAATSSPVTTDATSDTIAAGFPAITLANGDAIILTGSVTLNVALVQGQFRVGLFGGPSPVVTDTGSGYPGITTWAPATVAQSIYSNNGSQTNPFSTTSGATVIGSMSNPSNTPAANIPISFSLTLTRDGANLDVAASYSANGGAYNTTGSINNTAAVPGNFTYNTAGFLMGSTLNGTQASFSNINVTHVPAVVDTIGPDLLQTTPADNSSFASISSNLVASFNENIVLGTTGTITIRNLSTVSNTVISLPGPDPDGTLSVSGHDLIIDPSTDLAAGDEYAIEISATAVKDSVGNPYAGLLATDNPNWSFTTDPSTPVKPGDRLFGVDFNRNDAFGSPSQSLFRIVSGSTTQGNNLSSYTKTIGIHQVTITQPNASTFEFRGANGDSTRAIPGGDTSLSFLVSDFIATRNGAIDIGITNLPAGDYVFRSYHLDTFTGSALGYAQGATTTTPNTIEARIGGVAKDSVQPTSLGTPGLNTTFINDAQIPTLEFTFNHNGISPLTIELRATVSNGSDSYLLLNGFELFQANP